MKRSRRRAVLAVVAVVAAIVGSAALVYFTPLLSVRTISVVGESSVSEQEILDRLEIPAGLPLVRVDGAGPGPPLFFKK